MQHADSADNQFRVGDGNHKFAVWVDSGNVYMTGASWDDTSTTTVSLRCPLQMSATDGHDLDMNGRKIVNTSGDIHLDPSTGFVYVDGISTGTGNKAFITFLQSDGTDDGYVGVASITTRDFYIVSRGDRIRTWLGDRWMYIGKATTNKRIKFQNTYSTNADSAGFEFRGSSDVWVYVYANDFINMTPPIPERKVLEDIRGLCNHPTSGKMDKDWVRARIPEAYDEPKKGSGVFRPRGVKVGALLAVVIKAVQELADKIDAVDKSINVLSERVSVVEKALEVILD